MTRKRKKSSTCLREAALYGRPTDPLGSVVGYIGTGAGIPFGETLAVWRDLRAALGYADFAAAGFYYASELEQRTLLFLLSLVVADAGL